MRCYGYCRVSTDRQAGERQTSLSDQERAITGLATKLGRTVEAWYRDEGASGATVEKRPALRRLLAECAADPQPRQRPGYVLVLNDSRWGRFPNPDQAAALRFELAQAGWLVRLVEADESENPTVRHVMRAIGGAQASEYRRNVQQNALRGSRGTAQQGFWAARAPYGYRRHVVWPQGRERDLGPRQRKAVDEKVALVPHESEAAIVRSLFARYASGTETLMSLQSWLQTVAPDRRWSRAAIRFLLTNPAYVGDVVSGRQDTDAKIQRPESEWVRHRDAHPALVDRGLFHACAELLARNGKWTSRVRADWLVSGIVQCRCGAPFGASGGGRSRCGTLTRSYRCSSRATALPCQYRGSIKKEWLEEMVLATVGSVVGSRAQRQRTERYLAKALAAMASGPADAIAAVAAQLDTATKARDRLVAAVADGTVTSEEAKARLTDLRRQIARLEQRRDVLTPNEATARALTTEREAITAAVLDFRRMASVLRGPALRELVRPWIDRATFDTDERTLTIDVRHFPNISYGALASMACPPDQVSSATRHVTRKVVKVGGRS